jgi:hypothetical protein
MLRSDAAQLLRPDDASKYGPSNEAGGRQALGVALVFAKLVA